MFEHVTDRLRTKWQETSLALNVALGREVILTLDPKTHIVKNDRTGQIADIVTFSQGTSFSLTPTLRPTADSEIRPDHFSPSGFKGVVKLYGHRQDAQAQAPEREISGRVARIHLPASGERKEMVIAQFRPHPTNKSQIIGVAP
jgi:hypothetical protein